MSKKGGHHGGAWKVAYADFVTAMMALFMVLWLTAQDQRIKEAVERAFRNPFSSVTKQSVGIIPSDQVQAVKESSGNFDSASAVELQMLRRLNQDLSKMLQSNPDNPDENALQLELSPEGLRISVFDRARKPAFAADSSEFTEYGRWIFTTLAWTISQYTSFHIELEGHSQRRSTENAGRGDDWDLTANRANASRRLLIENGVDTSQIRKVAGYADTMPMADSAATDESNSRVTVMMRLRPSEAPSR